MEIEQTVKAKPAEAKAVNSIYVFVIKSGGKPVKRWGNIITYNTLHILYPTGCPKKSCQAVGIFKIMAPFFWTP